MANDPKTFDPEAFCQAIRTWGQLHPTATWLDLANGLDSAPDANAMAAFLSDPEAHSATRLTK
jgi:hypothetical protein